MRQLSLLLWSWIETTRNTGRMRLWGPFLGYAVVQWAVILLLTQFHRPLLSNLLVPLLQFRFLGGEAIVHYPVFYIALPVLFSRLSLLLDLLFGAWLLGGAFLLFWQADRPAEPFRGAFGHATRCWWKLVAARVPVVLALFLLIFWLPRAVMPEPEALGGNTIRLLRLATIVLGSMIEAAFLYASLAILVEGRGVAGAIRRSIGIVSRIPLASLGAVLIPNLIQIPISFVLRHSETIALRLSPEMVGWVLALAVAAYMIASFYIVGAGARLFRVRTEGPEA